MLPQNSFIVHLLSQHSIPLCSVPPNNWEYSNFQQREQLWSGLGTLISSPLPSHKIPMHRTPLIFYRNEEAFILEDELDRADENKGSCKLLRVNWYFGWPHFWPMSNRILTTLFLCSILLSPPVSHNIMLLCAYSEYDHKIVELGDRVPVSILSLLRIRSNICRQHAVSEGGRVELWTSLLTPGCCELWCLYGAQHQLLVKSILNSV